MVKVSILEVKEAFRSSLQEETALELMSIITRRPFQSYEKGLYQIEGIACHEAVLNDVHRDRVGLLQGTKEDGG